MPSGEKKANLLATRYRDGAARGLGFTAPHLLLLDYAVDDERATVPLAVDLRAGAVERAGGAEVDGTMSSVAACGDLTAGWSEDGKAVEVRRLGEVVHRLERTGKHARMRFSEDQKTLFTAATEVMSRWDLATGRCARKHKCFDRVTHVATSETLVAAQNKEGVICLFDGATGKRLVSLRPTATGWLAFADDGAWDASPGFDRGVELSWTDAKSTAFVPDQGFGRLELNSFPLTKITPPTAGKSPGLLSSRTAGHW